MTKAEIVEKTMQLITRLPKERIEEVADFVDFLLAKCEDQILTDEIQNMVSESAAFDFLNEEEDLYSLSDIIEN